MFCACCFDFCCRWDIESHMDIIELKSSAEIMGYLEDLDKRGQRVIALDIEAEFNLHCYGEHLCLIQIFDLEHEIIIDPFNIRDTRAIKGLFEKRDLLKIMYDSSGDAALLEKSCSIRLCSVLDLKPAVTLLKYPRQGLSDVLSEELGIAHQNKKRFQRYNWMRRPISRAAIEYAMGDVIHLFSLKDKLLERLRINGLLDTYILHNLMVQDGHNSRNRKEKFEKAKGYNRLDKAGRERFRKIFAIRDAFAKKLNKPPDYVFSNARLLDLCRKDIHDPDYIEQGINPRIQHPIREEIFSMFAEAVRGRTRPSHS